MTMQARGGFAEIGEPLSFDNPGQYEDDEVRPQDAHSGVRKMMELLAKYHDAAFADTKDEELIAIMLNPFLKHHLQNRAICSPQKHAELVERVVKEMHVMSTKAEGLPSRSVSECRRKRHRLSCCC